MAAALLLAAFGMVGTATADPNQLCGKTDTLQGTYNGGTYANGVALPQLDANTTGYVCMDKDGGLYVTTYTKTSTTKTDVGSFKLKGAKLKWIDSDGNAGSGVVASLGPAALPFETAVIGLLETERASLAALTPFAGLQVYALELSDVLKLLGDNSEIWGDTSGILRLLTDGVFGFEQSGTALSVIASITADGMTPVRYDFDPGTLSLDFELAGGMAGSNFLMGFTNGSLDPFTQDGLNFLLTANAVSEPASLSLVFFALTALLAVRRARR